MSLHASVAAAVSNDISRQNGGMYTHMLGALALAGTTVVRAALVGDVTRMPRGFLGVND